MTSAAKIAANRRNAQRSTGPRSAPGKARTRYNALHYRFSVPARYDPKTDAEVQGLAVHLSADTLEPCEQDLAMRAAEAQFDLFRMQRAKVDLINGIAKHLKYTDASLGEGDHLALALCARARCLRLSIAMNVVQRRDVIGCCASCECCRSCIADERR